MGLEIRLFGEPEVLLDGKEVALGAALPTLALFILWRHRSGVEPEALADALKPRSSAETDRTSFLKKHKKTLRERLGLRLPETLKLTTLGAAILEQAWVDVVCFDEKVGSGNSQDVQEALALRSRGPLMMSFSEPDVFAVERARREAEYLKALWELFEASRTQPQEALRFLHLQLECAGLAEDRAAFLREERLALEHELFRSRAVGAGGKTTREGPRLFLPGYPTGLIGREAETAALEERLSAPGLVTLTGPAGIGKTRLAVAAADRLQERFPGGAGFADLAAASNAEQITAQISAVLGLMEEKERSRRETLLSFLTDKALLLVWDNCEHLTEDCADLAAEVLQRCPSVRLLATSREALRVYGERLYPLPVLPEDSALRLFGERAEAVSPGFEITEQNRAAVLQICRDLDGLPLALELAAALLPIRTLTEIAGSLSKRFALLVDGPRGGPSRHVSLEAAFDLSYALLSPVEQALFRALGVFAGSFSRGGAEAVCAAPDTGPLLARLVRKSLVITEENSDGMRFRLLASLRQYAEDKLKAQEEWTEMRRRHREYFFALAEEAGPQLRGPDQEQWLNRLEAEIGNLRIALLSYDIDLRRSKEEKEAAEIVQQSKAYLQLAGLLLPLWQTRGHLSEGRDWLNKALQQCERAASNGWDNTIAETKGEALWAGGVLALCQNDYDDAESLIEKSLTIRRQSGDPAGISACLDSLGSVAMKRGDGTAATALFRESLSLRRQIGDPQAVSGSLSNLGLVARDQGNHEEAAALFTESLAIRRQLGNPENIASSLKNLGMLAAFLGNYADGIVLLQESLKIYRLLKDQHEVANLLRSLGGLALMQRDFDLAQTLVEESRTIYQHLEDFLHMSVALCILGSVALQQGDCGLARAYYKESFTTLRQIEHPLAKIYSLEGYSAVTHTENQLDLTAKLIGAAQSCRSAVGIPLPPVEQKEAAIQIAEVQAAMGVEAFEAALAEGQVMTWEQAVSFALGETAA